MFEVSVDLVTYSVGAFFFGYSLRVVLRFFAKLTSGSPEDL